jgi:hypothetical protein
LQRDRVGRLVAKPHYPDNTFFAGDIPMVNSTKIRCLQCGLPVNAQSQFCEHCGSAVARSAMPRPSEEAWEEELENPTIPEVRLPRARPAAPAAAYKFKPEQLVLLGSVGAAVLGIVALLGGLAVMTKATRNNCRMNSNAISISFEAARSCD